MNLQNQYLKAIFNGVSLIYVLLCLTSCNSDKERLSSKKTLVYKYESPDVDYQKYNFESNRIFVNDSVFIDMGLLGSDTTAECNIKFSHKGNHWKVWDGDSWREMFGPHRIINKVNLKYTQKIISPLEPYILSNDTLYAFTCHDTAVTSHYNEFLFSAEKGVVIIKNVSTYFKRDDYTNSDLKKIEETH